MERIEWLEKYMLSAERLINEDRVEEGVALLNNLLFEEPGYARLHNHLGWAHMYYTHDEEKAELYLKMAIHFGEEYGAPCVHLANLYVRQERYAEAIACAQNGLVRMQVDKAGLLEIIGQAYELRSEFGLAIKTYREASFASVNTKEVNNLRESMKRCRKKRMTSYWHSRKNAIGAITRMLF